MFCSTGASAPCRAVRGRRGSARHVGHAALHCLQVEAGLEALHVCTCRAGGQVWLPRHRRLRLQRVSGCAGMRASSGALRHALHKVRPAGAGGGSHALHAVSSCCACQHGRHRPGALQGNGKWKQGGQEGRQASVNVWRASAAPGSAAPTAREPCAGRRVRAEGGCKCDKWDTSAHSPADLPAPWQQAGHASACAAAAPDRHRPRANRPHLHHRGQKSSGISSRPDTRFMPAWQWDGGEAARWGAPHSSINCYAIS